MLKIKSCPSCGKYLVIALMVWQLIYFLSYALFFRYMHDQTGAEMYAYYADVFMRIFPVIIGSFCLILLRVSIARLIAVTIYGGLLIKLFLHLFGIVDDGLNLPPYLMIVPIATYLLSFAVLSFSDSVRQYTKKTIGGEMEVTDAEVST